MQTHDESRLLNNPVVRVVRWTLPWVLLAVVSYYLWGFYTEFKLSERSVVGSYTTEEEKALQPTSTVEASGTPLVGTTAVALVDGVRLRTTAAANGQVTASVGKGTRLTLLEQKGAWYRVRDPLGHIGWVTSSDKFIQVETKK